MATRIAVPRFICLSRSTFASSSRTTLPILRAYTVIAIQYRLRNDLPSGPARSKRLATTFASSPASSAASPEDTPSIAPYRPSIRVIPPSLEAIKEEGYLDDDVQLLKTDEAVLNITPEAIQQLINITSREPPDILSQNKLALRVGVESGGCHGYQYTMAITEDRGVDDYVLQPEGLKCIPVVIDLISFGLLKGATLHHATELIGSSFRLQENPQAKEGGACGCGVSWEAK